MGWNASFFGPRLGAYPPCHANKVSLSVETALATETGNTERMPVNAVGEQAELFFDRGMAGTANPGFPAANPCLGRRVEHNIEATTGTRESCSQGLG
jgi:hypothetical protein